MRLDYSREALSKDMSVEGQTLWGQVRNYEKRAYNRAVAPFIIDNFLDLMEMEDPEDFMPHTGVLTWISVGMFDSAAKHLKNVVYQNLSSEGAKLACSKLVQMLELADDYPKSEIETTEEDSNTNEGE